MIFRFDHPMKPLPPLRLLLLILGLSPVAWADVKLPAIFSDHMVLKKSDHVPVWGKADPGEVVRVTLGGQSASATADPNGKWKTTLNLKDSPPGPFEMVVEGKTKRILSDVVVGEVWLASGQSNMEWILKNTSNAEKEIAESTNPLLRQFRVKSVTSATPVEDAEGTWVLATPETTPDFSAVGYFFGKKLQKELNVPVGIIKSAWGGTPSEAWTSPESLDSVPDLKAARERLWSATETYPAKKQAFIEAFSAWIKENRREDQPVADPTVFAGLEVSTEGWVPVSLPGPVAAPGLPKAGAIWLRKEVNLPGKPADSLSLVLPIDGYDSVYWNGKLLQQTTYHDARGPGYIRQYGKYQIPPTELREGKNVLAIRIYDPTGTAKFPREPRAGSQSLSGEWLAKAEYAFHDLDPKALASAPQLPANPPRPQDVPSFLFHGMIHPILPFAITGAIWYQGESNAGRAFQYRTAFPLLITDWRKQWNQGDFPFYFCQLANFMPKKPEPGESGWAELREAQSLALKLPKTGQAVLIDLGESADIHPRNKKDVGERLAAIALAQDYGKSLPFSGPVYDSLKIDKNKAILTFKPSESALVAKPLPPTYDVKSVTKESAPLLRNSPSSPLEGFAICGEDKKWFWADASIEGNTVVVTSDKVPSPVAVRYAWSDNPTGNLYNAAGFPAAPFRTDDFPPTTINAKY